MRTIRAGAVYAAANILAAGVPFLLLPILTRALTPAQYGEVVSFYVLVALSAAVAGLGLHGAVGVRWLSSAQSNPRSYTGSALVLVLAGTIATAVVVAAAAPAFGVELPVWACAAAGALAGATTLQGIRFAVWQSRGQPVPAAALQVSSALLNIALSLLAVLLLSWGGLGRIAGAVAAGVVVAAVAAWLLARDGSVARATGADLRALLRYGIPLIPHTLAGAVLANVDRLAVSSQLGTDALGIYGAAAQLGMVMTVLADAAMKAFTPMLYRRLDRNSPRARLWVVGLAYISVPVCIGAALLLWLLLLALGPWILGAAYREALGLSLWFLLGNAVTGVYFTLAGLFFFSGKTEWISVASISASLFAVLAAPWAVSRSGQLGGALTYLATQVALLASAWALSRRIVPMPWTRPRLAMRVLWRDRART